MQRSLLSGGNWNNGANAGVFNSNGNNARSNANGNVGFRSALPSSQILQTQGFAFSAKVDKGRCLRGNNCRKTFAIDADVPGETPSLRRLQHKAIEVSRMEKYRHVFERFATFENVYDGYLLARKNKRYQQVVLEYSANLEDNIVTDVQRLNDGSYSPGAPHQFYEYFPKVRLIHSMPFQDRVLNCAAYNVLWPIYSRSMYEHSYGSIPDRGTAKCVNQVQSWMQCCQRKPTQWYMVKMDIAKFFFRIPINVQLEYLGRPLDDPRMMWFLEKAIRCDGRAFGLPIECTDVTTAERVAGIGMQVGSLISQVTANVVMTPADFYIKRELRVPYYARYMDDMLAFLPSKEQAWDCMHATNEFLETKLGLQLNKKTAVLPVGETIEFVGRRISPKKIELRKSTSLQMKRHLAWVMEHYSRGELPIEYCLNVIQSYLGLLKHCNNDALRNSVLDTFVLVRNKRGEENE